MSPCTLQLLQLPEEILSSILAQVDDLNDLERLARTCIRLNNIAEAYLYRSIVISYGFQAVILSKAIAKKPQRACWVRNLLVSTKYDDGYGVDEIVPALRLMHNLQGLSLETPDCNQKLPKDRVFWVQLQERYERIFEHSSMIVPPSVQNQNLQRLRSCTLHFVDGKSEICLLSKYASLFLHPTLRSLRISCASTDYPSELLPSVQDDPQLQKSSALEFLHLEECDLLPESLAILLRFPKALKSLTISEGTRYSPQNGYQSRKHGNMIPGELVQALQSQKESLEHLSLSLGFGLVYKSRGFTNPLFRLDLSEMDALRDLELDIPSLRNMVPPISDSVSAWRRMPPRLKTLKIFAIPLQGNPVSEHLSLDMLRRPLCSVQLLSQLKKVTPEFEILTYDFQCNSSRDSTDDDFFEQDLLEQDLLFRDHAVAMKAEQYSLEPAGIKYMTEHGAEVQKQCGVQLRMALTLLPDGFIPPYLHFELHPREIVLF